MATYAIGDIQGCYQEFLDLLQKIQYDQAVDSLWLTGDIVNRGPDSLQALRFVKSLSPITVLGNHDLHLLAIHSGKAESRRNDTLSSILDAPDCDELMAWLRRQPLIHSDPDLGFTMVHAGLSPGWTVAEAIVYAGEIHALLTGPDVDEFYNQMYGDRPDSWSKDLAGWERYRFITNSLTRIRYCYADGRLEMGCKAPPGSQPQELVPWYSVRGRRSKNEPIIFGHWATVHLGKQQDFEGCNVFPLDTGCVWGRELTALRLDDRTIISVPSRQPVHK